MDKQLLAVAGAVLAVTAIVVLGTTSAENIDFNPQKGEAVIVPLSGTISPEASSGLGSATGITPKSVRNLNERAMSENPDAIIYEINSGGGAVVASKEVKREIESVNTTTVCRFRDLSASGGYLIALGCDEVVADSATLTGSIGVRSSYLQFSGLLERYGVKYVNISSGEYKEIGSPYSNITEEEKDVLTSKVEAIREEFLNTVVENRNLSEPQIEEVGTGEPILGERAKRLGLVDELGGRATAVQVAENLTEKQLSTEVLETGPSFSLGSLFFGSLGMENQAPLRAEY
ncbi:S49 family peptidase [Candidatus Nanohalococcus occultus]